MKEKKDDNKNMLFEMMHKVGGMPIKEIDIKRKNDKEELNTNNFSGISNNDEKIDIEQKSNGMYVGQIEDKNGNISAITAKTMAEINEWLYRNRIRKIKWNNGKISTINK